MWSVELKRLGDHNRHRQWTRREKEDEPEVKAARRVFGESRKVGRSLKQRASKVANGEYPLRDIPKGKAILLLALLGIGLLFTADQLLKPGSVYATVPESHPGQVIWADNTPGNTNAWNCRLASYNSTIGGITLNSNTTHTAMCITKSKIDMSTVSGRELLISYDWYLSSNPGTYPNQWGWFFTTNNTIPNETANYLPNDDIEVSMVRLSGDQGGGNYASTLYIQRQEGQAISSVDFGCRPSGSVYICGGATAFPANSGVGRVANTLLNYTGNPNDPGHNSQVNDNNVRTNQDDLSWFQFATVPYYFGFFEMLRSPDPIGFSFVTPSIDNVLMPATPQPPPQNIDTGGFFGPIIRALIQIGVIALAFIAQFLGYLADVFVTAMNAVGNFFGLGAIGTAIRDALTGTANFIVNVFAVTVGWAVTLASLFQNGIAFVTNFFSGSNGFVAWLVSFLSTLPGIWAIIQDFWTAVNTVVLGMNYILVIYYMLGMFQVYKSGWNGFQDWLDMGTKLTISVVKAGYWLGKEMFQIILDVKRLLAQWI